MYDKMRYIKSYSKCLPRWLGGRLIKWLHTLLTRCALLVFISSNFDFRGNKLVLNTKKYVAIYKFRCSQKLRNVAVCCSFRKLKFYR